MDTVDQPSVRPKTEELGQSGAKKYSMRGMPQLSQGTTNDPLATADNLWLQAKVYASGGENSLHAHTIEDHSFFVLQGEATFYFGDGSSCGVQQYEGVMIPKGTSYRFQASEEVNLVLLRIGGAQRKTTGVDQLQAHGTPKVSRSGSAKTPNPPAIAIPGKFFPKDA
jgi:mannose-6-phosphate isomerase-like protein (cupin superfamily)